MPRAASPARLEGSKSRELTKQETREALLRAGMELFGEEGLDGPSLDAICERAGFTRGAFYVHFRDRDEFLEAVMDRVGGSFLDAVLGTGDDVDLLTTARRFLASIARGEYPLIGRGGVRPHQLLDACVRSPSIRARYVGLVIESIERIGRMVQRGQREELLRDDVEARQVATLLLAAIIGAQTMIELRVPFDFPSAAATTIALLAPDAPRSKRKKRR